LRQVRKLLHEWEIIAERERRKTGTGNDHKIILLLKKKPNFHENGKSFGGNHITITETAGIPMFS
jgi:hypothetical protein